MSPTRLVIIRVIHVNREIITTSGLKRNITAFFVSSLPLLPVLQLFHLVRSLATNRVIDHKLETLPNNGGRSTKFGAGDLISAAIGPRRTVGVHCCCFTPIVGGFVFDSYYCR